MPIPLDHEGLLHTRAGRKWFDADYEAFVPLSERAAFVGLRSALMTSCRTTASLSPVCVFSSRASARPTFWSKSPLPASRSERLAVLRLDHKDIGNGLETTPGAKAK